jgi:UDP-2,3-diacylglucosamine hydrolase
MARTPADRADARAHQPASARSELPSAHHATIGLLAGAGALPGEIVRDLRRQGRRVHVVALEGSADAGDALTAAPHTWTGIGQIKRMLDAFRDHGCRELMIAGGVRRPDLWKLRVDAGFFWNLPAVLSLMRGGDDRLLRRVIRFFELKGFTVRGLPELTPALLADAGPMTATTPTEPMQSDAKFGAAAIAALGRYDVGQAVVVCGGQLRAVEGAEGTDGMLRRLAAAREANCGDDTADGILVKLPKPGQDTRVDLPTIGPATIVNARAAGIIGIAVQEGATAIVGRAELCATADQSAIPVWGIRGPDTLADSVEGPASKVATVTRHAPTAQDLGDCAIGRAALAAAAGFGTARGVVVIREHVLAIGIDEPAAALVARSAALRQWGDRDRRRHRRRGVLVLASTDPPDRQVVAAVSDAGLSTILALGDDDDRSSSEKHAVARDADACGISLLRTVL